MTKRLAFAASLLLTGCAVHVRSHFYIVADPTIEGKQFVAAVADKMPMWDADVDYAVYERAEIATVKADIAMARRAQGEDFFSYVEKLHADWDALVALDEQLKKSYVL
jgi:hypothetical protein